MVTAIVDHMAAADAAKVSQVSVVQACAAGMPAGVWTCTPRHLPPPQSPFLGVRVDDATAAVKSVAVAADYSRNREY